MNLEATSRSRSHFWIWKSPRNCKSLSRTRI